MNTVKKRGKYDSYLSVLICGDKSHRRLATKNPELSEESFRSGLLITYF